MELSERILRLLGKRDDDPALLEFLDEFKPHLHSYAYELRKLYNFSALGFSLFYDGSTGSIERVSFHIFTNRVASGNCQPFEGLLPFSIPTDSSRDEVRQILGATPTNSHSAKASSSSDSETNIATWHDKYEIPPWTLNFTFGSPDGVLQFVSAKSDEIVPLQDQNKMDAMLWRECMFCGETHDAASRFVLESNNVSVCHVCVEGFVNQFRDRKGKFVQKEGCSVCAHKISRKNAMLRVIQSAENVELTICEICAEEVNEGLDRFVARTKMVNKIAEPDMHFPDFEPNLNGEES